MTVFVVSLFLPYTVNFGTSPDLVSPEDVKRPENSSSPASVDYFSLAHTSPILRDAASTSTIPLTPGATTATERIFVPETIHNPIHAALLRSTTGINLHSLVRTDTFEPSWGHGTDGIQPKSRAKPPPPASILRHLPSSPKTPPDGSVVPRRRRQRRTTSSHEQFPLSEFTIGYSMLGNGGLVSAVDAAQENGILDHMIWVGTLGLPTDAIQDHIKLQISERLEIERDSCTVWVEDDDMNGHYEHYSKTILWPILHYQIPDSPKSKAYLDHSWVFYKRVNQAFADCVVKKWKQGDTVWVHDYHLLLVPGMVRDKIPNAQIGFYLHTAFPSSEVFRVLSWRTELLQGMLGANMIGFQTEEYVHHFLQTCGRLLNVEVTQEGVVLEDGRFIRVDRFPVGIDPSLVDVRRNHPHVKQWIGIISDKYAGKKLIIARDKLDSVRGVKEKLEAYEQFLHTYPEFRDNVVLIQIATWSTEDTALEAKITEIASRLNGKYSTLAHQPLVFLKQEINYYQWIALLMVADALAVTSLREGMNLTGHEFVCCQDGKFGGKKNSPLIISEFTGSATLFRGSALLVNPWDKRECAESFKKALDMSAEERGKRWEELYDVVLENDAISWLQSYFDALGHAYRDHTLRDATAVPRLSWSSVSRKYEKAASRLLFLDYEGTLAVWNRSVINLLSPKKSADILNELIEDAKNTVYVMSSRRPEEMEQLFQQVPGLGMIAENGAYLLEAGSNEWIPMVDAEHVACWKMSVKEMLKYYIERAEKSKIEELNSALVFDYAASTDKQGAFKLAGDLANHINDMSTSLKVLAVPIDDGLCISSADVNKSSAPRLVGNKLLSSSSDQGAALPEFLMVIGDSREDEYVFEWAHSMKEKGIRDVVTVAVGQRNTAASGALSQGVTGVLSLLSRLTGSGAAEENAMTMSRREMLHSE